MLEPAGLDEHFEELNRKAVAIALEARERCDARGSVVVAATVAGTGIAREPVQNLSTAAMSLSCP